YNAASELVMARCDGIVFVADAAGERAVQAREALQAMVSNAQRHKMDLASLPVAMQYHRTDLQPGFNAEEMDAWLGIAPGTMPRFATSARNGTDPAAAVAWVLTELARRHDGAGATNGA
ncbi:MAG: hypothetical protein HKO57_10750, partial [Akkermansiaceae bacterium]|nr:hypothetical protein [Akkermansiaceae bacterium]